MTCINTGNMIICFPSVQCVRLHVGKKYVWMSFHRMVGPTFYTDAAMQNVYDPVDEKDPIWPEFEKWHVKYKAKNVSTKSVSRNNSKTRGLKEDVENGRKLADFF